MPTRRRFHLIDTLRGFALVNMIIFHALWDVAALITQPWGIIVAQFMQSPGSYIWQQCIGVSFIFISGFCWSFGRKHLRRGVELIAWGLAITVVTLCVMPSEPVHFGVLTLLGFGTLITIFVDGLVQGVTRHIASDSIRKVWGIIAAVVCIALFVFLHDVQTRTIWGIVLPNRLYANNFTTLLGFPYDGFISSDYYPLIPWVFVMFAGYFLYHVCAHTRIEAALEMKLPILTPLEWIGRHSLIIYLAHQIIIFAVVYALSLFK